MYKPHSIFSVCYIHLLVLNLHTAENIKSLEKLPPGQHYDIIVLDGTWRQARDIFANNPFLCKARQVRFSRQFQCFILMATTPQLACIAGIKLGERGSKLGRIQDFREGDLKYGSPKAVPFTGCGIPCRRFLASPARRSKVLRNGIFSNLRPSQHVKMFHFLLI